MKNRFVDGEMSKQGYDFPDGANQFFTDGQQFKYTYAQAGSESEAINKAKSDIKLTETDQTFVMKKQLKNGEYSVVVFAKANGKEYYH
ncbi:MAG: hypothetical protein LBU27_01450 [Candidatus Peribacteria bacterium]|jgi:hypothetical protein|nr:hypothetical protein [Candidatus Peribacteria bacterium]